LPVIEESLKAYDKAQGPATVIAQSKGSYAMAEENFHAKLKDLYLALGKDGGVIDLATNSLNLMSGAIERVTNFANNHPTMTKFAVAGFAVVSMALVAGGAMLILSGGVRGLMLAAQLVGVSRILPMLGGIMSIVGRVVFGFGRIMLVGSPLGLVLLAIGFAAYEVYKHWSEILPRLKQLWSVMKAVSYLFMDKLREDWNGFLNWIAPVTDGIFKALDKVGNGIQWLFDKINSIPNLKEVLAFGASPTAYVGTKVGGVVGQGLSDSWDFWKDKFKNAGKNLDDAAKETDKINKEHEHGSANIKTKQNTPIVIHTKLEVQGKTLAQVVTYHQTKAANRVSSGFNGFDGTMGMQSVVV
jgi:hypothetical protein